MENCLTGEFYIVILKIGKKVIVIYIFVTLFNTYSILLLFKSHYFPFIIAYVLL
jgi:hypothetical protein